MELDDEDQELVDLYDGFIKYFILFGYTKVQLIGAIKEANVGPDLNDFNVNKIFEYFSQTDESSGDMAAPKKLKKSFLPPQKVKFPTPFLSEDGSLESDLNESSLVDIALQMTSTCQTSSQQVPSSSTTSTDINEIEEAHCSKSVTRQQTVTPSVEMIIDRNSKIMAKSQEEREVSCELFQELILYMQQFGYCEAKIKHAIVKTNVNPAIMDSTVNILMEYMDDAPALAGNMEAKGGIGSFDDEQPQSSPQAVEPLGNSFVASSCPSSPQAFNELELADDDDKKASLDFDFFTADELNANNFDHDSSSSQPSSQRDTQIKPFDSCTQTLSLKNDQSSSSSLPPIVSSENSVSSRQPHHKLPKSTTCDQTHDQSVDDVVGSDVRKDDSESATGAPPAYVEVTSENNQLGEVKISNPSAPPALTLKPNTPPALTQDPADPPALTQDPADPPVLTLEPTDPPALTLYPNTPPALTLDTADPPALTLDPADLPAITLDSHDLPALTLDPTDPPVLTLDPNTLPALTLDTADLPALTLDPTDLPAMTLDPADPPVLTLDRIAQAAECEELQLEMSVGSEQSVGTLQGSLLQSEPDMKLMLEDSAELSSADDESDATGFHLTESMREKVVAFETKSCNESPRSVSGIHENSNYNNNNSSNNRELLPLHAVYPPPHAAYPPPHAVDGLDDTRRNDHCDTSSGDAIFSRANHVMRDDELNHVTSDFTNFSCYEDAERESLSDEDEAPFKTVQALDEVRYSDECGETLECARSDETLECARSDKTLECARSGATRSRDRVVDRYEDIACWALNHFGPAATGAVYPSMKLSTDNGLSSTLDADTSNKPAERSRKILKLYKSKSDRSQQADKIVISSDVQQLLPLSSESNSLSTYKSLLADCRGEMERPEEAPEEAPDEKELSNAFKYLVLRIASLGYSEALIKEAIIATNPNPSVGDRSIGIVVDYLDHLPSPSSSHSDACDVLDSDHRLAEQQSSQDNHQNPHSINTDTCGRMPRKTSGPDEDQVVTDARNSAQRERLSSSDEFLPDFSLRTAVNATSSPHAADVKLEDISQNVPDVVTCGEQTGFDRNSDAGQTPAVILSNNGNFSSLPLIPSSKNTPPSDVTIDRPHSSQSDYRSAHEPVVTSTPKALRRRSLPGVAMPTTSKHLPHVRKPSSGFTEENTDDVVDRVIDEAVPVSLPAMNCYKLTRFHGGRSLSCDNLLDSSHNLPLQTTPSKLPLSIERSWSWPNISLSFEKNRRYVDVQSSKYPQTADDAIKRKAKHHIDKSKRTVSRKRRDVSDAYNDLISAVQNIIPGCSRAAITCAIIETNVNPAVGLGACYIVADHLYHHPPMASEEDSVEESSDSDDLVSDWDTFKLLMEELNQVLTEGWIGMFHEMVHYFEGESYSSKLSEDYQNLEKVLGIKPWSTNQIKQAILATNISPEFTEENFSAVFIYLDEHFSGDTAGEFEPNVELDEMFTSFFQVLAGKPRSKLDIRQAIVATDATSELNRVNLDRIINFLNNDSRNQKVLALNSFTKQIETSFDRERSRDDEEELWIGDEIVHDLFKSQPAVDEMETACQFMTFQLIRIGATLPDILQFTKFFCFGETNDANQSASITEVQADTAATAGQILSITCPDNEELELANQLRDLCDDTGRESDTKCSAQVLHKLGRLYRKKSPVKLDLIRSAVLIKAAIIREPDDVEVMRDDLKELCQHLLCLAGAQRRDVNLIDEAEWFFEHVKEMRRKSKESLERVHVIEGDNPFFKNDMISFSDRMHVIEMTSDRTDMYDMFDSIQTSLFEAMQPIVSCLEMMELLYQIDPEVEALEKKKIQDLEEIQEEVSKDYMMIMRKISNFCIQVLGDPPCDFAQVGMGSLAREEVTPYSDFENVIVLKEGVQELDGYEEALEYFRWYAVIFQLILINFGETIIPSVAISSLNDFSIKGSDWFFDNVTGNGISFDGFIPHACKSPLGWQEGTPSNPGVVVELIQPVNKMLEFVNPEDTKDELHLSNMLMSTCFVAGMKDVYDDFRRGVQEKLSNTKSFSYLNDQLFTTMAADVGRFDGFKNFSSLLLSSKWNVKRVIYRTTTIFVSALGQRHHVAALSSFGIIDELAKQNVLEAHVAHKLKYAVALACEVRLKVYLQKDRQDDWITSDKVAPGDLVQLFDMIGVRSTYDYFTIAIYLHMCVESLLLHGQIVPLLPDTGLFIYLPAVLEYVVHCLRASFDTACKVLLRLVGTGVLEFFAEVDDDDDDDDDDEIEFIRMMEFILKMLHVSLPEATCRKIAEALADFATFLTGRHLFSEAMICGLLEIYIRMSFLKGENFDVINWSRKLLGNMWRVLCETETSWTTLQLIKEAMEDSD